MQNKQQVLQRIQENTTQVSRHDVRRVIVLYEEEIHNIGDCCVRFDKLKYFRSFFDNAEVSINFRLKKNRKYTDSFLKNNPHLAAVTEAEWEEIDFPSYDVVIAIAYNEEKFLQFLYARYGPAIAEGSYNASVYSMSQLILPPVNFGRYIFTLNEALTEHVKTPGPGELYLSSAERGWGNAWLEEKGMKPGEDLVILLDSTLRKEKLLRMDVYFEFLSVLLGRDNVKVLVFDEAGVGKEEFYRAWLGDKLMAKMIFSKGLKLREDLCIIGSGYTRMMFGPCTGLLHCASAIFNRYVSEGMPPADAPLLVVYTGQYAGLEQNANAWWGNAPLISCLMLKQRNGRKELTLLSSLSEEDKAKNDSLPCSEFTTALLLEFVASRLRAMSSRRQEAMMS
jgi:hypothetical protein